MFISRNTSPFPAEPFVTIDKSGTKSLVVVIRATYTVRSDGTATISEQPSPLVFADSHYGDPATTAVQHESDFAPVKPHSELVLNAIAMAPSEKAVTGLEVALLGPGLDKRAQVIGERRWAKAFMGMEATPPKPFRRLPLAGHLAFGGADQSHDDPRKHRSDLRNPVGTGFHVNADDETIEGLALPCIERLDERMMSWRDKPEPIGFGPVPRFAQSRARFAGTYDQQWMDEVLPFLPQDFDECYYQSAPVDQQLRGLSEGTEFMCLNMNATGRFVVRLPALQVPVQFLFDDQTVRKTVRPDTLIMEPHLQRVVLVGRTQVRLPRKFTRLREIQVGSEPRRASTAKPHYENLAAAMQGLARSKAGH